MGIPAHSLLIRPGRTGYTTVPEIHALVLIVQSDQVRKCSPPTVHCIEDDHIDRACNVGFTGRYDAVLIQPAQGAAYRNAVYFLELRPAAYRTGIIGMFLGEIEEGQGDARRFIHCFGRDPLLHPFTFIEHAVNLLLHPLPIQ